MFVFFDNFNVFTYSEKFGLYEVDFGTFERFPRKSAHFYQELIRTNSLDLNYEPENFTGDENSPKSRIREQTDEDNEII